MSNFKVLFNKELLEQWRTKKILILGIVFVFMAVSSPILAKLTPQLLKSIPMDSGIEIKIPEPTAMDAIDQFIKNISQTVVLVLLFVFAGSIADEKNKKTLELTLTKPVQRKKFVLSKYLSAFLTTTISYVLALLIFIQYTETIFGSFNLVNFTVLSGLILLIMLMMIALTLLASTIFSSNILAVAFGFLGYIIFGSITNYIKFIKDISPSFILSKYKDILQHGWSSDFVWPAISCFILIMISIFVSINSFSKQEIER